MSAESLLEGLTDAQTEAVTHGDGPLLVVAGPGSGKTRVITHRAGHLARTVTDAYHILAITFTNKAAAEMAERMARLAVGRGVTCSTFHSFCARLLRIHAERAGIEPNFSIFDTSDQLAAMKQAIERADLSAENFPPAKVLGKISRAKNDMRSAADLAVAAAASGEWSNRRIVEIYEAYEAVLAEQNGLDFDDLLVKTARLLGDDPELRAQLQDRYRYVLVDEYQDTNHAQYLIARGLALEHENLCVTGDPDQSIYAWRGANLRNILDFEEDFPQARVVRLEQNYRSTPQILSAADSVIAHNRRRKLKELWTHNEDGPEVVAAECENAQAEAAFIAQRIVEHAASGGRYGDVAVFYRVNALSRQIEAALTNLRIPYQVARGVAFYARKEIKDTLAYLRVIANPRDAVSLARIINVPARRLGPTTVERVLAYARSVGRTPMDVLAEPDSIPGVSRAIGGLRSFAGLMAKLAEVAADTGCREMLEYTIKHTGLLAMWGQADDEDAIANVDELVNAAAEFDRQRGDAGGSLTDWLTQISLVSDVDSIDPDTGAVTLMTLHGAKGLEFDTVFVAGVEHGLLPHQRSLDAAVASGEGDDSRALEEERRLCFVGMTRAKRSLALSWACWREFHGAGQRTSRSVFVTELPEQGVTRIAVGKTGRVRESGFADDAGPASPLEFAHWQRGQFVRHEDHGLGRVLWIRPGGQRTYAGIHFVEAGEKTIVLEYAKLEEIEPDEIEDTPF